MNLYADPLCAQTDPEIFFPAKGDTGAVRAAKKVCMACEHRFECLEDALVDDGAIIWGIRGGMTARERREVRHDRARKKKAAAA